MSHYVIYSNGEEQCVTFSLKEAKEYAMEIDNTMDFQVIEIGTGRIVWSNEQWETESLERLASW